MHADLDPAADRTRSRRDRVELRAQPVRRGLGVGVGGGDQAVGREPLRGQVHALAAGVADAGLDGLDHVQGHLARGGAGALLGGVGAAVEHEQDLVVVARVRPVWAASAAMQAPISSSSSRAGTTTQAFTAAPPPSRSGSRPALVVLVAFVRQHADRDAFAAVPDRPRPAAVLDDPGLVEAVAPGDVLERVLADRRPEAGRDVPDGVLTRDRAAGDRAHVERLAPVLDRQVAAGGGVVGEGDVADRVDVLALGAHALVDGDALDVDAGRHQHEALGQLADRPRRGGASRRALRASP